MSQSKRGFYFQRWRSRLWVQTLQAWILYFIAIAFLLWLTMLWETILGAAMESSAFGVDMPSRPMLGNQSHRNDAMNR